MTKMLIVMIMCMMGYYLAIDKLSVSHADWFLETIGLGRKLTHRQKIEIIQQTRISTILHNAVQELTKPVSWNEFTSSVEFATSMFTGVSNVFLSIFTQNNFADSKSSKQNDKTGHSKRGKRFGFRVKLKQKPDKTGLTTYECNNNGDDAEEVEWTVSYEPFNDPLNPIGKSMMMYTGTQLDHSQNIKSVQNNCFMDDIFNQAGMHNQLKNLKQDGGIEDGAVVVYMEPDWTNLASSQSVEKDTGPKITGFFRPRKCMYDPEMHEYEQTELQRKKSLMAEGTLVL